MRRGIVWLFRAILLLSLCVAAGILVPRPLLKPDRIADAGAGTQILVLSNTIHTDIAIPIDDRSRRMFSFLADAGFPLTDPNARWLVFGWGGRAFYLETPTWAELKPLPAFRAFTLDRSVMHVEIAGGISDRVPGVRSFRLDDDEFLRLQAFMLDSFARRGDVVAPIPGAAYGGFDRFFEAHGYFNALFGCNTWTAAALRAGGLRTGLWNPLPQTLAWSLMLYN